MHRNPASAHAASTKYMQAAATIQMYMHSMLYVSQYINTMPRKQLYVD